MKEIEMSNKNNIVEYVRDRFNQDLFKHKLQAALKGFNISEERFLRGAFNCINSSPELSSKVNDPMSVVMCVLRAAALRLELDPAIGHAYVVPYGGSASLDLSYKGLLELCYRSNKVTSVRVETVFSNDFFEFENGTEPLIKHRFAPNPRGEISGYWCCIDLINSGKIIHFMNLKEIEQYRDKHAKNKNIWNKNFDAMAKKTVFKQCIKFAPKSIDISSALSYETEQEESYDNHTYIDVHEEQKKLNHDQNVEVIQQKSNRLNSFINNRKGN